MHVRHIVTWNFKPEFSPEENQINAHQIKKELEAVAAMLPGIIKFEVIISPLATGNRDIAVNSLFESEESLAAYQIHPEHVRVNNYVGTKLMGRACFDYFE